MLYFNSLIGAPPPPFTPHTTFLVLPLPKSSAGSTAGVSIGKVQAGVSEEGCGPRYTNTKAAGNCAMIDLHGSTADECK